jgi:formate hydrogenlyase subunit 4
MVHELPFILSILVPVILSGGIIKTTDLIQFQQTNFIFLRHPSIIFSFLAAVVCTQAKLMLSPFDVQAQEADISGSVYTEYSGIGLATYRLTSMASLFVMPFFLTLVFLSGITLNGVANILLLILKIFVVILLTIVIKNKTLRFKPKQAARFFLGPMTAVGIIAVLLAFLGL